MRLMGASSKSSEQIGRFGTGWKYGIAGVMRIAGKFEIQSGLDALLVGTTTVTLRGVEHQEITIDDKPIGITDQLGKDWEPWMVLREFIANALDEGGHRVYCIDDDESDVQPTTGLTRVIIPYEPFAEVYDNLDDYFCLGEVEGEIMTNLGRAIPKRDENISRIFKKGVLVKKLEDKAVFDYELNDVALGEDRVAGDVRDTIWKFIDDAPVSFKKLIVRSRFEANCYNYRDVNPDWLEVFDGKLIVSTSIGVEDEMIVPSTMVDVAERVNARTLKNDLAAKAAQRETMAATFTVREVCKKLLKIGIEVDSRVVLMAKLETGEELIVDKGLIYLAKDLTEAQIYENLIIAATTRPGWQGKEEQIKLLASLVRRLAKQ